MNKDKKELNDNEVEKVSGGNSEEQKGKMNGFQKKLMDQTSKMEESFKKLHEDIMHGKFEKDKKELNDNEIEKISGGNSGEQKGKLTDFQKKFEKRINAKNPKYWLMTAYGGPELFPGIGIHRIKLKNKLPEKSNEESKVEESPKE